MKATFKRAVPYADDVLNLPVADVEAAIPFYQKTFGFEIVSRSDTPFRSAVLGRDEIQIGLAENGGNPEQEGCFFEVDDVAAAFQEIKGTAPAASDVRVDRHRDKSFRVFFVIAPDRLCYCIGERVQPEQ
jgi:catechol 2,3-dioxygenase-like lactoylglutathione lyase family enzyme